MLPKITVAPGVSSWRCDDDDWLMLYRVEIYPAPSGGHPTPLKYDWKEFC